MNIAKDAREAVDAANGTGPQHGAHAAPAQPPQLSRWGRINADATAFEHTIAHLIKVSGHIIANPQLEEGVELLMTAIGLGAEARDLELVLVQLRHIVAGLQAAQPLPAPAADGSEAM